MNDRIIKKALSKASDRKKIEDSWKNVLAELKKAEEMVKSITGIGNANIK